MKKYEIRINRPLTNIMTVEERIYDMLAAIGILEFHLTDQKYGQCITFMTELTTIKHKIITYFCCGLAHEFNHPQENITLHEVPDEFKFEDYTNTDLNGQTQEGQIICILDELDALIDRVLEGRTMEIKQQARKEVTDIFRSELDHWVSMNARRK